ncbi:hypothetical protein Tco_0644378 [Tanacetum coccineum]
MTKVIKGEFEKIKDVKVEDVSLTCDTSLEVFNNEVNRLSGMDDDLFTYEVEVANIPCDSKMDDDSKHEANDDMGYDPSDVAFTELLGSKGDDEVELTDEESSNDKDEVAKTVSGWMIRTLLWRNTSGSRKKKLENMGKCLTGKLAKYGKIWNDDDIHDLRFVETEFLAIAFNDEVSSKALSCGPMVSSLNNEIDFRISFDDSDDEDYTPAISCLDDLDFFKEFENEFPAIVYNDALTSKLDLLTEPILNPQHVNEFDLKNETSLSKYDEEEQNVLYFNDLFPFNVINPNDLKSDEDRDDNEIDIIQSLEGNLNTHRPNMLMETSRDKIDKIFDEESFVLELNVNIITWIYLFNGMLLCFIMNLYVPFIIPFDPKWYYKDGDCTLMLQRPRYQGLEYTDVDIADFEERLEMIYSREIHRVQVVDFQGMPELMRDDMALPPRELRHPFLRYEGLQYTEADIKDFEIRLTRIYKREVHRVQVFDFRGLPDLMVEGFSSRMLMEHKDAQGVKSAIFDLDTPRAYSFRWEELGRRHGLESVFLALGIIPLREMTTVGFGTCTGADSICMEVDDTWAWVAMEPKRHHHHHRCCQGVSQRMARIEEDVHEMRGALTKQHEVIDAMAYDFSRFSTWAVTSLARMMDRAGVAYVPYYETHVPYQRRRDIRTKLQNEEERDDFKCVEAEDKSNLKTLL